MDASERTRIAGNRRDLIAGAVTAVILVVSVTAGWQAWRTQDDLRRTQDQLRALVVCQARVNDELRKVAITRERSATDQIRAQLRLVTTPPGDVDRALAAVAEFAAQLRATLATREANPFPTRNC